MGDLALHLYLHDTDRDGDGALLRRFLGTWKPELPDVSDPSLVCSPVEY